MDEVKPKLNTFVIPLIRNDMIARCLETIYKYTPDNFYVYIVDQTKHGMDMSLRDKYKNLMVIRTPRSDKHHTGNLGFAQASNLAIQLVQTPYVTFLNDDVEFINNRWWEGVERTFEMVAQTTPERPAMIVNLASIKLPDWSVGRASGYDFYIMPYKKNYTDEDWDFLVNEDHYVNEHLTIKPGSVIDGINLYCSVTDTKKLIEVGMCDECFYPGGAEDYDLCCRASMFGYRSVGTTLAWVFHHWSQTFKAQRDEEECRKLVQDELRYGNLNDKWGEKFDLWGVRCPQCQSILDTKDGITATCPKHPDEIYTIPETTIQEL